MEMYTLIAQGRRPSVPILMNRLGISKRTVFRYLRIIDTIDRITYDPKQKGYAFLEGNRADKLRLSHDELTVVLAAGEAVSHLGKSFGERFRRLIGNIDLALKPESGL
jgi:predicted DNA-binding transcriptional regulator YafY